MTELLFGVVVQAGFLQKAGSLVALAAVLGMAAFGFQHGLFLTVLYGLGGLATLFMAVGLGEPLANVLMAVDVPPQVALPAGIGLLAVGLAVGMRVAIGAAVPEGALRFSPLIDKVGGVLIGCLAGMILGGILLVVLAVMPIPEPYRIHGSLTRYDLGATMLRTFARFAEPGGAARELLLNGEPPPADAATDGVVCSEIFVDVNGNGLFDDGEEATEKHLDHDGSGAFTPRVAFIDANQNGIRDIGLLERYRLGAWQNLRVMHHPTITSPALVELPAYLKDGQEVYKATATDLDPGDEITYSLRSPVTVETPAADGAEDDDAGDVAEEPLPRVVVDEPAFALDAASGVVTITGVDPFMRAGKPATIVVVATDKQGLTDELKVTIKYRGPKPRE